MKLIFTVVFLAGSAVSAQQPIASATSKATIEYRGGGVIHVTSNSSFEYVHLFKAAKQSYDDSLLQVTQHNEVNFEAEGVRGSLRVRAWQMRGHKRGEPLWSFTSAGNEGTSTTVQQLERLTKHSTRKIGVSYTRQFGESAGSVTRVLP